MKKALPTNGKIAKDAKDTVQECVSEFISFITSEASDKCQKEKRKTINGDDLLWAMATLGFEDYIDPLKAYLSRYRELEGDSKGSGRGGDGSGKKDTIESQLASNAQVIYSSRFFYTRHELCEFSRLNFQARGSWEHHLAVHLCKPNTRRTFKLCVY
uniref:Putative histone-fold protein n=1 Tax=Helianthus annuus TaxID=4232 RepID=A0A251TTX0_HELAN